LEADECQSAQTPRPSQRREGHLNEPAKAAILPTYLTHLGGAIADRPSSFRRARLHKHRVNRILAGRPALNIVLASCWPIRAHAPIQACAKPRVLAPAPEGENSETRARARSSVRVDVRRFTRPRRRLYVQPWNARNGQAAPLR
jgi:hypothetical protein